MPGEEAGKKADREGVGSLVCAGCNRPIEWCSFCDEAECPSAICYRCLLTGLKEWVAYPAAGTG